MDAVNMEELSGAKHHFFVNSDLVMILNGTPKNATFMREGDIYHVVEPRILIVLEGSADVRINLEDYHLQKGCVVMIGSDTIGEFKRCSDDVCGIGIALREGFDISKEIVMKKEPAEFNCWLRMMYLLWDVLHLSPYRKDTVHHLISAIVTDMQYLEEAKEQKEQTTQKTRQKQQFQHFKQLVSKHCGSERTIPFYAEQMNITPHHLSAIIKRISGKSVMYWVNRAVIQKAKLLLRTKPLMAYEVAHQLNFPSDSAFSKFFKRETGMTVKQYQESAL